MVSKKRTKINKKQTLIFLRSPKHFNIGKRKVISFNNKINFLHNLNLPISTYNLKNNNFFFSTLISVLKYDRLYRVNSIKVITETKVSWVK